MAEHAPIATPGGAAPSAPAACLSTPFAFRGGIVARNRVAVPPMVVCGLHPDSAVTDATVAHYAALAAGGAGVLIQEATCVSPDGKLAAEQLGLWEDGQVEGMRRLVETVRPHGPVHLVQIHHSPVPADIGTEAVERIRDAFVRTAVRAQDAGFHGVELHGAHGYLLSRFLSPRWNRRDDRYGEPIRLAAEILEAVRSATRPAFLVGIRLGVDCPDLPTGLAHAVALDRMGVDFLDVSRGHREEDDPPYAAPCDFPFHELAHRAAAVKPHVAAPVIGVGSLDDPAVAANYLAAGHADFAAVGRGHLVDPAWARKALADEPRDPCLHCPSCKWFRQHELCPGRLRARRIERRNP